MKRLVSVLAFVAIVVLFVFTFSKPASAEDVKMVGEITKIELAGKDTMITLKDNKSGKLVVISVNDESTINKLKDHRISVGDELRCKYEVKGGKNVSKIIRKTAGC